MQHVSNDITVDKLLKAIYKECVGCCGHKEDQIEFCDLITCPFHIFRMTAKSLGKCK